MPHRFLTDLNPLLQRHEPDLVVFDSANTGAELAARLAGIPAVAHGIGPDPSEGFEEHRRVLTAFSAELGLSTPEPGHTSPYLDIYPPTLRATVPRQDHHGTTLRPVPHPGTTPVPARLLHREPGEKLVQLTFGTEFATAEPLRTATEVLARPGIRLLTDPAPHRAARHLATEIAAMPAPEEVVPLLPELAAG
ncbi:hypothetical protein [Actinopolyspora mortivallis]|uniref:hypothetical protein n=1 Tax=Actinopolyspora mortivallis TaxID=33906 RepID=UPI0003A079BE|nr:hypothetical protein [Actinopolyspora mortivallis]